MKRNIIFLKIKNNICDVEIVRDFKIFSTIKKYRCTYREFITNKEQFIKCSKVVLFYEKNQSEYIKQIETEIKKLTKVFKVCNTDNRKLSEIVVYYEYDKDISGKIIIGNKVFEGANRLAASFDKVKIIDETNFNKRCEISEFTSVYGLNRLIEKYSYLYKNELFYNEQITIKQVYENYKKNDLLSKRVFDILLEVIIQSIENIIYIIDPNLIILNFNLGKYENEIIEIIKERLFKNTKGLFKNRIEVLNSVNKKYLMKIVCGNIYGD